MAWSTRELLLQIVKPRAETQKYHTVIGHQHGKNIATDLVLVPAAATPAAIKQKTGIRPYWADRGMGGIVGWEMTLRACDAFMKGKLNMISDQAHPEAPHGLRR
jgi:hypothetical protein